MTTPATAHYAKGTDVPVSRSQDELRTMLKKHNAARIGVLEDDGRIEVLFVINNRRVKFGATIPDADAFLITPGGQKRTLANADRARDQFIKERWRGLVFLIRAKLESVEQGYELFEEAFMANIVLPESNQTLGEQILPALAEAYRTNTPLLLNAPKR